MVRRPTFTALSLVLAPMLTGCVTAGDMEKLEARLTQQMRINQSRVEAARAELQNVQQGQESLRSDTNRSLAEAQADLKAGLEAIKDNAAKRAQMEEALTAKIDEVRHSVIQYGARSANVLTHIAANTDRVSTEIQGFREGIMQSLIGSYRAEEDALRVRLNGLVKTRLRLQAVAGDRDRRPLKVGSTTEEVNLRNP